MLFCPKCDLVFDSYEEADEHKEKTWHQIQASAIPNLEPADESQMTKGSYVANDPVRWVVEEKQHGI